MFDHHSKNSTTVPAHLSTSAQFIRSLLETFYSLFVAALWGMAAIGAFVSYLSLAGLETVALPPFVVFVIGALVGLTFNLTCGGLFRDRRTVSIPSPEQP